MRGELAPSPPSPFPWSPPWLSQGDSLAPTLPCEPASGAGVGPACSEGRGNTAVALLGRLASPRGCSWKEPLPLPLPPPPPPPPEALPPSAATPPSEAPPESPAGGRRAAARRSALAPFSAFQASTRRAAVNWKSYEICAINIKFEGRRAAHGQTARAPSRATQLHERYREHRQHCIERKLRAGCSHRGPELLELRGSHVAAGAKVVVVYKPFVK